MSLKFSPRSLQSALDETLREVERARQFSFKWKNGMIPYSDIIIESTVIGGMTLLQFILVIFLRLQTE